MMRIVIDKETFIVFDVKLQVSLLLINSLKYFCCIDIDLEIESSVSHKSICSFRKIKLIFILNNYQSYV